MKKKKTKLPKPRNALAIHSYFRGGAGAHDKPFKVKRRNLKIKMKKGESNDE